MWMFKAGHRILLEAQRGHEEAVNHVHRAQAEVDFAIHRQVHGSGDHVIFGRGIGGVESDRGFAAGGGIHQVGLGRP